MLQLCWRSARHASRLTAWPSSSRQKLLTYRRLEPCHPPLLRQCHSSLTRLPLTVIRSMPIIESMPLNITRSMPLNLNITRSMSLTVIRSMFLTITRSMPLTVNKHSDTLLLIQCRSRVKRSMSRHILWTNSSWQSYKYRINPHTYLIRHYGSILGVPWGFCMRVDFWSGRLVSGLDSPLTAPLPVQKNKLSYQ